MTHSVAEIFTYVLLDICLIVVAARVLGRIAAKLRQPPVVGEIVAGIALGPTLLGALPGNPMAHLFPADVVPYLKVLAQVGLVLFMFLVGLELDVRVLRGRGCAAGAISLSSIVVPFTLGAAVALVLYRHHHLVGGHEVSQTAFTLFLGVAMSITAFPVLARILSDRRMQRSVAGTFALAAAAVDDVLAWTLLAFVVAVVKGSNAVEVVRIVGLTIIFATLMLVVVRRILARLLDAFDRAGRLTPDMLVLILVGALGSAWITDKIGIHAIFGAFLFGTVLPHKDQFTREVLGRLEQVSVLLLLPLFFVVTGFGVDVGGLSIGAWVQLGLIISVAVAGKLVGAYIGARLTQLPRRQSAAVAVLINTRGLTELVILSVGRELGVLDDEMFTMMVLMALITTAMATPVLDRIYPERIFRAETGPPGPDALQQLTPLTASEEKVAEPSRGKPSAPR